MKTESDMRAHLAELEALRAQRETELIAIRNQIQILHWALGEVPELQVTPNAEPLVVATGENTDGDGTTSDG